MIKITEQVYNSLKKKLMKPKKETKPAVGKDISIPLPTEPIELITPQTIQPANERIADNRTLTIKRKYDPSLMRPPRTSDEQNKLADELVAWSKLESSIDIKAFPISKNINPYRFKKLRDRNEYFREAYDLASAAIGARLGQEWHDNKISHEYAKSFMGIYDPDYKAEYKERMAIIKDKVVGIAAQAIQVVEVEKFESSPLVPEKKQ